MVIGLNTPHRTKSVSQIYELTSFGQLKKKYFPHKWYAFSIRGLFKLKKKYSLQRTDMIDQKENYFIFIECFILRCERSLKKKSMLSE